MIPILHIETRRKNIKNSCLLTNSEVVSLIYHSIFNYPLDTNELNKWSVGERCLKHVNLKKVHQSSLEIKQERGYFFIQSQKSLIFQRLLKKEIGKKKKMLARKAARVLSNIPSIKLVALTGSTAMDNAAEDSDIDFLIITKKGTLWISRLFSYLLLRLFRIQVRKFEKGRRFSKQKDKLCLNMWLDEGGLVFRKRNIFSAHEIAQIAPLINKDQTYEKLLLKNKWIGEFWPNATKTQSVKHKTKSSNYLCTIFYALCFILEPFAYKFQRFYMRGKITREVINPSRAIFHPFNWERVVGNRLKLLLG